MGSVPTLATDAVRRLWLQRQGLGRPRGEARLTRRRLVALLENVGGLQLDPIHVLERAHYLTLWSRFGSYDRALLDRWIHRDRAAYEYWGHEASLLPVSHLPLGRRRMRGFPPPNWTNKAWWKVYGTSPTSKRRVLRRLREEGPLESADFDADPEEFRGRKPPGGALPFPKEDRRSLKLLWHAGRVAVAERRHFRCVYDLAERVYPEGRTATTREYEESWLRIGLLGNGVASEAHLTGYCTGPAPDAATRKRVIARQLERGDVVEVHVEGSSSRNLALPEHVEGIEDAPEAEGTTLLSPFDSLLWQRRRPEDLLGFRYRVEIYVPPAKREYGYYVLPILHEGRLVGRLDPKLHRDQGTLEVRSLHLEPGVRRSRSLETGLGEALHDLRTFVGAERLALPRGWTRIG